MGALLELDPALAFDIFTETPRWFFEDSLENHFSLHSLLTDIGLVQESPLRIHLTETQYRLDHFFPLAPSTVAELASHLRKSGCSLVLCDIAPMGILAAKEAGIPSVLVENFTWDWIYEAYVNEMTGLIPHIRYLKTLFSMADVHIQAEPVCERRPVDLTTPPVSRKPRKAPAEIRKALALPADARAVLITMGGISASYPYLRDLEKRVDVFFIIPGASGDVRAHGNLILLPHHSPLFHPDLVQASDAVVGKAGYSTIAEVFHAGVPFGYIVRPDFRESSFLASFIQQEMEGICIQEEDFNSAAWVSRLDDLLALPRSIPSVPNGASEIARFLSRLLCASTGSIKS
jgi:UDP:flavonoid glycosyltransferase YjiC (YdhE family)